MKIRISIICGVLILSVVAGLLIRMFFLEESRIGFEESPEQIQPRSEPPSRSFFSERQSALKDIKPTPSSNKEVAYNIYKEKYPINAVVPLFKKINESIKISGKPIIQGDNYKQTISTTTSDGIILLLTKEQFHFLYPDSFIAGLVDAQNLFLKEYDPTYEPVIKIETDAQVRYVEEKIVAAFFSANMITKEKSEQFIKTIRFTLPQLQLIDLATYSSYDFYRPISLNKKMAKKQFLSGFMEKLMNVAANKTRAAVCGSCSSRPECFQEGSSIPGKAGSELFYLSCYCTGCLTSLGCLSANNGTAAIYDQATGICGIGY